MTSHMIDWISARVPCFHPVPLDGGRVMKVKPDGSVEWEVASRLEVEGSHSSNLLLRTYGINPDGAGVILELSGNPTKWMQGHNLFGGFLAPGPLLELLMYRLCEILSNLQPTDLDFQRWHNRHFELQRVDVNRMFALGRPSHVRAWLRAAEHSAYLRHRGKGTLTKDGTLYFGKHSRRWAAKFYAKGDELEAGKDHALPKTIQVEDSTWLSAWAADKLRFEVVLRAMELKDRGLRWAYEWSDTTGAEILKGIAEGIQMSDQLTLPTTAIQNLPARLRMVYETWQNGTDLRSILPKKSFYRYRNQLLPHGVDIAIRQPHEDRSNVIPLVRILEAIPASLPDWVYGTPLLLGQSDLDEARRKFRESRKAKVA